VQTDDSVELCLALSRQLPTSVRVAAAKVNVDTDAAQLLAAHAEQFPEEAALVSKAVPKRVREFLVARNLSRELLASLGKANVSVGRGTLGEPLFPPGVVGSITHSNTLVVVTVAETCAFRALGLDIEPNQPLPPDVCDYVSLPGENDAAPASRAVFVAKEAFYKAHCGVHRRMLDFTDVRLQWLQSGFIATELTPPTDAIGSTTLNGRFVVTAGWLAAFCAIEA
jgi:4'-phosphopantetheinyl transferase EntD